ncbi:MAG: hypothetical protein R3E01_01495 [Pirellulaceae bacterium]|nr:hypothetical protein [Planctomycetales bacterium]
MNPTHPHTTDLGSDQPPVAPVNLAVTAYERTASTLVASLIITGLVVLLLLIIWLTSRLMATEQLSQVELIEPVAGRGDHAMGVARDLEAPGAEEVEDITEPELQATLESVTDVISSQAAQLDSLDASDTLASKGRGQGDSRPAGPLGEGEDIVPRWERWEIRFESTNLRVYAKQLDFFGIELAAFGGSSSTLQYAANLSSDHPTQRTGDAADEKRIYMTWRNGPLKQADIDLLHQAGIATEGRMTAQFYPPKTENVLAVLENQALKGRDLKSVKKTIFGIRPAGSGYEFYVLDLQSRLTG